VNKKYADLMVSSQSSLITFSSFLMIVINSKLYSKF